MHGILGLYAFRKASDAENLSKLSSFTSLSFTAFFGIHFGLKLKDFHLKIIPYSL
jgi:hypothetical protein